ncbi:DUF1775 domain-containing protein [Pendulispora rubella]|uniref:DUF1775 domain-containing protein n=1 Tax=Pendulispora rubella TaxID=2741070 RepID=A0ABZ2KSL6_9BACT
MSKTSSAVVVGVFTLVMPALAAAHISLGAAPAFADTTQEITFGVGHGCDNKWDTFSVQVDIPPSVTTVRAIPSDFGKVTTTRDSANVVKSIKWEKLSNAELQDGDPNYYKLGLRIKVPNQPFTRLLFPTHQVCRSADGKTEKSAEWVAETDSPDENGPKAAPALVILPPREKGWNKYTVPAAVADLKPFFGDALIVWKGNSAYSPGANTLGQIKSTADVTELTSLAAGDVVWVKY